LKYENQFKEQSSGILVDRFEIYYQFKEQSSGILVDWFEI